MVHLQQDEALSNNPAAITQNLHNKHTIIFILFFSHWPIVQLFKYPEMLLSDDTVQWVSQKKREKYIRSYDLKVMLRLC